MAGIFGLFDFTKPGKGVDKDAPEKHPFFLFFELVWRKLGRLMLLNLIYFLMTLPLLTGVYLVTYSYLMTALADIGQDVTEMVLPMLPSVLMLAARALPVWLSVALLLVSAVLYGPASCGMAFMLRNFTRQQHAWNSDFWDRLKQNFKQGLMLGLLDILVLCLLVYNLIATAGAEVATMLILARYASLGLLLIYLFMRNYFFVMAVTFHLTLRQLLKNAWILAVVGIKRNLLALTINGALFALVFMLSAWLELVTVPLLLFSFTGFVSMFITFPVVKKYMMDPQTQASSQPEGNV